MQTANFSSSHREKNVIFLHPGQSATRSCTTFPRKTIVRVIRKGEALIAICRRTRKSFLFVCGVPHKVKVVVLPKKSKIRVHCRK